MTVLRQTSRASGHRYFQSAPPEDLRQFISCFWGVHGDSPTPVPIRVIPDGCADIVVDHDGRLPVMGRDAPAGKPKSFIVGPTLEPALLMLPPESMILGIRLLPGACSVLFGLDASEISGTAVPLDAVDKAVHQALLFDISSIASLADRLELAVAMLRTRLADHSPDPVLLHFFHSIASSESCGPVPAVSGVSSRTLSRRIGRLAGLGPKRMLRSARFIDAVRTMHFAPTTTLADLSIRLGFTDQAHFGREFKAMSGLSPKQWLSERMDGGFLQYLPLPLR